MKNVKKIRADKIDHQDKRFIYRLELRPSGRDLPAFLEYDDRYIPVAGDYDNGGEMIDAFIYPAGSDYETVLADTLVKEETTIFDAARLINKLEKYAPLADKRSWSKHLKIGIDKWNEIKELATYEAIWQKYFLEKKAPLKRILHFNDATLRSAISPLLTLNPGINILESIADLLKEIAHRDNSNYGDILKDLDVFKESELPAGVELKRVREELYNKRYPTIAAYRKMLDEHLRSIPRSAKVDIYSDESFETPGIRLQADIRSKGDIEKLQNWLKTQKKELEGIIDIQKGNVGNEQEKE